VKWPPPETRTRHQSWPPFFSCHVPDAPGVVVLPQGGPQGGPGNGFCPPGQVGAIADVATRNCDVGFAAAESGQKARPVFDVWFAAYLPFNHDDMNHPAKLHAQKRGKKEPLTREMLLPIPASAARDISLKNHFALAAMRGRHGSVNMMLCLLQALYLCYFLHES
jgi:hypothetical protein